MLRKLYIEFEFCAKTMDADGLLAMTTAGLSLTSWELTLRHSLRVPPLPLFELLGVHDGARR